MYFLISNPGGLPGHRPVWWFGQHWYCHCSGSKLEKSPFRGPEKFSNHRCKRSTWFQTSKKTLMVSLANLFTVFFLIFLFIIYILYFCWWSSGKKTMPASTAGGCCCHQSSGQGDDWCVGGELSWQTPGQVKQHGEKLKEIVGKKVLFSRWTANPRVPEVEGWLTHLTLGLLI